MTTRLERIAFASVFGGDGAETDPYIIDPDNVIVKPFIVKPGRTMLTLRFISEALGCTVDWDAVNREIIVSNW